jgi:hypothetical protein
VKTLTVYAKTVSRQTLSSVGTASLHKPSLIAVRNIEIMYPRSVKTMKKYSKSSSSTTPLPTPPQPDPLPSISLKHLTAYLFPLTQPSPLPLAGHTSHPNSHPLHRQRTLMSLLSNNILPPQEPSTDRTTRSQHHTSHSQNSKHSNPVLGNHTSSFGVPDEVEKPEVCR